jgi:hypothetical protein
LIGEQTSCTIQHIPDSSQAALTYELSGKNMKALVLVNFSEDSYISLYKSEQIKLIPMSVKVVRLDEAGELQQELWHSATSIPYKLTE